MTLCIESSELELQAVLITVSFLSFLFFLILQNSKTGPDELLSSILSEKVEAWGQLRGNDTPQ